MLTNETAKEIKDKIPGISEPSYNVILVASASLTMITSESDNVKIVQPLRYDPQHDEPAFQRAWQKVAEAQKCGEIAATSKLPPGGIRLRGSRTKSK